MDSTFYFESDHVALRGNPDYNNALRYMAVLLKERASLSKHIEELMRLKKVYTEDPSLVLQKLQTNEPLVPTYLLANENVPQIIKKLTQMNDETIKSEPFTNNVKRRLPGEDNKTDTFNRLWTCEEQRRLEDLLIKYPPEAVEMHRFTKIAKELGNRTPLQVSSRVQKYFQKLYNAGLPIPGRIPKNRRSITKQKHTQRSSTFFPVYNVPVNMPDEDMAGSLETVSNIKTEPVANDEVKPSVSKLEHGRVLELMYLLRNKSKENRVTPINPCELCYLSPKNNFNWHCFDCNWRQMICSDCMVKRLLSYNFEHILHNVVIDN